MIAKRTVMILAVVFIASIMSAGVVLASTLISDTVAVNVEVQEPIEFSPILQEKLFSPNDNFWPGKPLIRWTMTLRNVADMPFSVLPRVMEKDFQGVNISMHTKVNGVPTSNPWKAISIDPGKTITLVIEAYIDGSSAPGTIGDLILQIERYLSPPEIEVEEYKGQLG